MPSDSTRNTLIRQWELLKLIPGRGAGKSAGELRQALEDAGFQVTKRQVERDLRQLQESFPLDCNDKSIPYGWRWIDGASIDIPGISLAESVSLRLIESTLTPLLPATVIESMAPRFRQAQAKLRQLGRQKGLANWQDKVRSVSPSQPLLPPKIAQSVLNDVQDALLQERILQVEYRSANSQQPRILELHPLGLIQRGVSSYLIAMANAYEDSRLYALHRMSASQLTTKKSRRPRDFNLDDYLATGRLHFGQGKTIKLVAVVDQELAHILAETPLSDDQQLRFHQEQWQLRATVADSWQLRWWILSQAQAIEIIKPVALRKAIAATLAEAAAQYNP